MATLRTFSHTVPAGQQFTATEFSIALDAPGNRMMLFEANLSLGSENKTWEIRKVVGGGFVRILRSLDSSGVPTATTDTDVIASGEDINVILEPGDQIQILTTGATSEMLAKLYIIEGTVNEIAALSLGAG